MAAPAPAAQPVLVDVHTFVRAETDTYFRAMVTKGKLGGFTHSREPASIDDQSVVRMNRDTLYSSAVFDLDAGPVTVTLPDPGTRYMSMLALSQDHYAFEMDYAPGRFVFDRSKAGTRYLFLLIRTFADPGNPADVAAVHTLQDAVKVEQAAAGTFEVPHWDTATLGKAREALAALGALGGTVDRFGKKTEVDPFDHLIGTAIGWGGNPRNAADYQGAFPPKNDGKTVYRLTLKDVPVDGFWSVSVYNAKGFFEKNDRNVYSLNNITAKPNADGSFTIQFGGCANDAPNCIPISPGWNYTVRLYRPRKEILDGTWKLPDAEPVG